MNELPIGTILKIVFGDNDEPDMTDLDEQSNDMVKAAFERAPIAAAVKDARVAIDPAFFAAPPEDDVDTDGELDPQIMKITAIDPELAPAARLELRPGSTLGKRMGISTTTIRKDADGTKWLRGFSADGTLIDCRVLIGSEDE
jgi:hypothetical protein